MTCRADDALQIHMQASDQWDGEHEKECRTVSGPIPTTALLRAGRGSHSSQPYRGTQRLIVTPHFGRYRRLDIIASSRPKNCGTM